MRAQRRSRIAMQHMVPHQQAQNSKSEARTFVATQYKVHDSQQARKGETRINRQRISLGSRVLEVGLGVRRGPLQSETLEKSPQRA